MSSGYFLTQFKLLSYSILRRMLTPCSSIHDSLSRRFLSYHGPMLTTPPYLRHCWLLPPAPTPRTEVLSTNRCRWPPCQRPATPHDMGAGKRDSMGGACAWLLSNWPTPLSVQPKYITVLHNRGTNRDYPSGGIYSRCISTPPVTLHSRTACTTPISLILTCMYAEQPLQLALSLLWASDMNYN